MQFCRTRINYLMIIFNVSICYTYIALSNRSLGLTYGICFSYARATVSVSLAPPGELIPKYEIDSN